MLAYPGRPMGSLRASVTSLIVTPAYVMLGIMFIWMLHLQHDVTHNHDDQQVVHHVVKRTRRELSTNALLNLLPGMTSADDVIYDMDIEPCGGAVFTVWGRSSCPEETRTDLVYAGIVGGTNVDSYGGGVDYLCLSQHPQWSVKKSSNDANDGNADYDQQFNDVTKANDESADSKMENTGIPCGKSLNSPCSKARVAAAAQVAAAASSSSSSSTSSATSRMLPSRMITREDLLKLLMGSSSNLLRERSTTTPNPSASSSGDPYLYGTEYQGKQLYLDTDNLAADTFVDQDAVCAVCRSQVRTTSLMIPGRRDCYAGWTKEYEGFLMSGPVGARAQHRFVCVHHAPEAGHGGFRRDGGAVFYHVRAMCGSLPCPTYIQDKEITCVVCTK